MEKRWVVREQPVEQRSAELGLALNINPVLATLLIQRGVSDFKSARTFFNPSLKDLHDPFLMKDMKSAASRLSEAVDRGEEILIYGDYDVDGTTSVALLFGVLQNYTPNLRFYINDREREGYGISEEGIRKAINREVKLIISIDCGIKASEMVALASEHDIDFIICDHHTPGTSLPNALAVLDPKREDCPYPYKELSGCGIGFKLLQALTETRGEDRTTLNDWLDLVAVSIAADVVPLNGENRIICHFGMQILQERPRPGLAALMEVSSYPTRTLTDVVFSIAPRINAAGRIAHASHAVELLLSSTIVQAREKAEVVDQRNTERKKHDSRITEEALRMIASEGKDRKSTVVYKEDWHKGVIGIVASRCIEKYHRPTIVLTRSNGTATGSARSIPGFDIYSAISRCSDLLDRFGGHKYAAGLTLPVSNVETFRERFEAEVSETIHEDLLIPSLDIDTSLEFDRITMNFLKVLQRMEPFGPENPQPVFMAEDVFIRSSLRLLKESHVKFVAGQQGQDNCFEVIGFGLGEYYPSLLKNPGMKIAFHIELNEYMGARNIQLRLLDIKFKNDGITG